MKKLLYLIFILILIQCTTKQNDSANSTNKIESKFLNYKLLSDTNFYSQNLKYGKEISIVVPYDWSKSTSNKFPLIILFDKQLEVTNNYILNTIDALTSSYQIPTSIIISIKSENSNRFPETKYSKDKLGQQNEQFIFDELIPFAKKQLNASNFKLLIGHSRHGFYTTYLFNKRINDLNGVIAFAPFFDEGNVNLSDSTIEHYGNSTKYYRAGVETHFHINYLKFEKNNKTSSNINIKGKELPNAEHNSVPRIEIANSLYEIFEYWYLQNHLYGTDSLSSELAQKNINAHYGEKITINLSVIIGKGMIYAQEKEYEKAINSWKYGLKIYPKFIEQYLYIANAKKELNIDYTTELEEFEKRIKSNEVYSDEEKQELNEELNNLKQV